MSTVKTFDALYTELRAKVALQTEDSGTVAAIRDGAGPICDRIVAEATRLQGMAEGTSSDDIASQIAQLIYQVQVLMLAKEIPLSEVYERL